MTIPHLPDIDLARIAPQSTDMKRRSLQQMKSGRPPFSYRPIRTCFADIFNIQTDLFGPTEPTNWAIIEALLRKKCRSDVELTHNLYVARGLYNFASSKKITGRKHEFFPLAMGVGRRVTFWLPMVLAIDGQPNAIFVEPRRSKGLGAEGRKFAFSMMNERIRAVDEDFSSVRLGIIRFADPDGDCRTARHFTDEGIDLFSLDELESMVASTYDVWRDINEERERETHRRAGGSSGPLI